MNSHSLKQNSLVAFVECWVLNLLFRKLIRMQYLS